MSPRSLVFSSDQETARSLAQVLRELELEVEHCVEIFAAVERLTGHGHEVIAADWDDGLEASFLLKTSRELTANSGACTVALVHDPESASAARQLGVDVVLQKPIIPDAAKYSLLTSDNFLQHMRVWLPQVLASQQSAGSASNGSLTSAPSAGTSAAEPSQTQSLFENVWLQANRSRHQSRSRRQSSLFIAALSMTFLSAGYVFSQPVRAAEVSTSVVRICQKAVETTQKWLAPQSRDDSPLEVAENTSPTATRDPLSSRVRITEVRPLQPGPPPQVTDLDPPVPDAPEIAPSPTLADGRVPDSLKQPWRDTSVGPFTTSPSPLLGAFQPVLLPEEQARKLLVEKVQAAYPDAARKAGVQGAVVLQAWIGKDGTVENLKLVRGYMILGQSAYNAVRHWKFKPYFQNGQAVEAQTFLTIDFRLP